MFGKLAATMMSKAPIIIEGVKVSLKNNNTKGNAKGDF